MKIFIPKMYQKDIYNVNYSKLKELGYKVLVFDLDNTIGSTKEKKCSQNAINLLNKLQKDFEVIVASNSPKTRVKKFLEGLNCDFLAFSLKPSLRSIRKIKKKYNVDYKEIAIIGDQIMTDILVGNRKGLMTILVDPINKDLKITAFNRKLEEIINKKNKIVRGNYYEKE